MCKWGRDQNFSNLFMSPQKRWGKRTGTRGTRLKKNWGSWVNASWSPAQSRRKKKRQPWAKKKLSKNEGTGRESV